MTQNNIKDMQMMVSDTSLKCNCRFYFIDNFEQSEVSIVEFSLLIDQDVILAKQSTKCKTILNSDTLLVLVHFTKSLNA